MRGSKVEGLRAVFIGALDYPEGVDSVLDMLAEAVSTVPMSTVAKHRHILNLVLFAADFALEHSKRNESQKFHVHILRVGALPQVILRSKEVSPHQKHSRMVYKIRPSISN